MKSKMKACSACGNQIAKSAKVCPICGAKIKKPLYKRWWFIALVLLLILGVAGSSGDTTTPSGEEVKIEYIKCTTDQLRNELDENALKAEETFDGQYIEVTGELAVIDSDGNYISLSPMNNPYALSNVQCFVKADEQLDKIMDMSEGDTVTVRGKVTAVGEILGYQMNIEEILVLCQDNGQYF